MTPFLEPFLWKKKRVFLPLEAEFIDTSKGAFKIETEKIFKDQIGFNINPIVQQMNDDKELIDLVQKMPESAHRNLDWTGKRWISIKIDDSKKRPCNGLPDRTA